jgi:hypothetical protein
MRQFDDTLQVCTTHRILQTLSEPCPKCLEEIQKKNKQVEAVKLLTRALEKNAVSAAA